MHKQTYQVPPKRSAAQQNNLLEKRSLVYLSKTAVATMQQSEALLNQYHEILCERQRVDQKLIKLKRRFAEELKEAQLKKLTIDNLLSVRLIKGPPRVVIDDTQAIPSQYTQIERVINTTKIRNGLIQGKPIPGAHLETDVLELELADLTSMPMDLD